MDTVRTTREFAAWLDALRDTEARSRILARIKRMKQGNFGDAKSVGGGVSELRIDYGPGYRVYFTKVRSQLVVILAGGDKRTQKRDIEKAKALADNL